MRPKFFFEISTPFPKRLLSFKTQFKIAFLLPDTGSRLVIMRAYAKILLEPSLQLSTEEYGRNYQLMQGEDGKDKTVKLFSTHNTTNI